MALSARSCLITRCPAVRSLPGVKPDIGCKQPHQHIKIVARQWDKIDVKPLFGSSANELIARSASAFRHGSLIV